MVEVNEWWQMLVIFVLAANPAAAAAGLISVRPEVDVKRYRLQIAGAALATVVGLVLLAAIVANPLVDLLSVDHGTFRLAAGSVMLVVAAQTVVRGHPGLREAGADWKAGVYPLGMPLVGGPALLAAMLNWSSDSDAGVLLALVTVIPALVVSVGVAVLVDGRYGGLFSALSRLIAVFLALAGVAIMVSGIQAV